MPPRRSLTRMLRPDDSLHLCIGTPWRQAVAAYLSGITGSSDGFGSCWAFPPEPPSFADGDLYLTVLDTTPRTLLCVERLWADGDAVVADERDSVDFDPPIPVPVVTKSLAMRLPPRPATFSREAAAALLAELQRHLADPSLRILTAKEGKRRASTSRERSSMLQAQLLIGSGGVCAGCDTDYASIGDGLGITALEVHHLDALRSSATEVFASDPTRLCVLCGTCHNMVHASDGVDLEAVRAAWRSGRRD